MTKKLVAMNLMLMCIFLLSPAMVSAQPAWCDANNPTCEGDFNCDCDVDGSDAAQFKSDFGRGQFKTPCPTCSSSNAELEARVAYLEALLANVTRNGNDITFSGVNVHIVNGSGTTDGTTNGLGNLIVGYNEPRNNPFVDPDMRTGSHNIVVGSNNNYSSYGGLVIGILNNIYGAYASVSGGFINTASNYGSSVCGGEYNEATGQYASVSGGIGNKASKDGASVSGGEGNEASGVWASVSGGYFNKASGQSSNVSAGGRNEASGARASVSGGYFNRAIGNYSFVGGGGSEVNPAWGNYAVGDYSAILGGADNTAGDPNRTDRTIGPWSTVSGGRDNIASGAYSNVSGGRGRSAAGGDDWVAGGLWQDE